MSAAVIAAVSCVAETKVVARLLPFHCTVELETKFDPFTVSVKPAPPWRTDVGDSEETTGVGLSIVKDSAADAPPPGLGFVTVMLAVPAAAISLAVMPTVSCVADTNVAVRLELFHCTVELEMKLLPFTVSVKALPPAVADAGAVEMMDGTGLDGGDEVDPEEPPPQPATSIMAMDRTGIRIRDFGMLPS
jgi:hypothetical protein